jgi:5-formyltetrahydrofolate cyclo-ligase
VDLAARKQRLRRELIARRHAVSPEAARRAALRAAERVVATSEFRTARHIALYAAFGGEIDARPIFDAAARSGKIRLLPRAQRGSRLGFAPVEEWAALVPGDLGALEPAPESVEVRLVRGDLVVVPGIAFDRAGHRLGRGGGHYDRTFDAHTASGPTLFGLGFDFQLVDEVPSGPSDRSVDAVVTESEVVRTRRKESPQSPSGSWS